LNEAIDGSAKSVFKPWGQRLDFSAPPLLSNEDDPELLIHIPFDGAVKIRAISIIGEALPDFVSQASRSEEFNRSVNMLMIILEQKEVAEGKGPRVIGGASVDWPCLASLWDVFRVGGADGTSPSALRAYINRDDLDFSAVEDAPPVQEWELVENLRGDIEYPTQVASRFAGAAQQGSRDGCGAQPEALRARTGNRACTRAALDNVI
jgi:PITH domain